MSIKAPKANPNALTADAAAKLEPGAVLECQGKRVCVVAVRIGHTGPLVKLAAPPFTGLDHGGCNVEYLPYAWFIVPR